MRKVVVWDAPTRLFHWLAGALVAAAYLSWRFDRMDLHARFGETLLALVIFRVLWGFFGSETARFSQFLAGPTHVGEHLARAFRREPDRQVGHNPAGGWMVLLLLALMLGETLTGIYVQNDIADEGPLTELVPAHLADFIDTLHAQIWNALLAAVVLHLLAILFYAVAKRQNLVLPMISGRKRLPDAMPPPALSGVRRALLLLGCSALAAAALFEFT
jgi:cytochrome b